MDLQGSDWWRFIITWFALLLVVGSLIVHQYWRVRRKLTGLNRMRTTTQRDEHSYRLEVAGLIVLTIMFFLLCCALLFSVRQRMLEQTPQTTSLEAPWPLQVTEVVRP